VTEVDVPRKRIGLSMKRTPDDPASPDMKSGGRNAHSRPQKQKPQNSGKSQGSLGDLLQSALQKK